MLPATGDLQSARANASSVTRARALILVFGGVVPFAASALYVYFLMPGSYAGGVTAAYAAFGEDRGWLLLAGALWLIASGAVAWLLLARISRPEARSNRGPATAWRTIRSIMWLLAWVETGMLLASAPMSSSLANIGQTGSIDGAFVWQVGLLVGASALIIASLMSLSDLMRAGGPRR